VRYLPNDRRSDEVSLVGSRELQSEAKSKKGYL